MNIQSRKPSVLILMLVVSFASFCGFLMTPALTVIASSFQVTVGAAQLVILVYLVGYAIGQLIYGPIANRWGRKKGLYLGVTLQLCGSILCIVGAYAPSFDILLVGRFIMALGACAGMVIAYAMVSDAYPLTESRRVVSYLVLAFAILTGVSTSIGGMLVTYISWQSCFWFLLCYGVVIFLLCLLLPETADLSKSKPIDLPTIFKSYGLILKAPVFWGLSVLIGCTATYIYVFAASAPVLAIQNLGLSAASFGYFNYIVTAGYFLGNVFTIASARKINEKTSIATGILIATLGSLILAGSFLSGHLTIFTLFFSGMLIFLGLPFILSNCTATLMSIMEDKSNTSAAMSFMNVACACVGMVLMSLFHRHLSEVVAIIFMVLVVLMLSLYQVFRSAQR